MITGLTVLYDADCPTVTAPLRRRKFVHEKEARVARATTARKLKFTLPGPMTLIDTLADGFYGDRIKMAFAFAELLNQEAKDLEKLGVDVVQFGDLASPCGPGCRTSSSSRMPVTDSRIPVFQVTKSG